MNIATIYCDGSFSRRANIGGYGVVVLYRGKTIEFNGTCEGGSAARMEMIAAIRAIEAYGPKADKLCVYSDSKYLVDGINCHVSGWIKDKWIKPITHKDLWLTLAGYIKRYIIEWNWVRAHSGIELNERADQLARQALMEPTW